MDDTDKANLILAALTLGFVASGHDEYKCTKEQLCQFASIIAATALEQFEAAQ